MGDKFLIFRQFSDGKCGTLLDAFGRAIGTGIGFQHGRKKGGMCYVRALFHFALFFTTIESGIGNQNLPINPFQQGGFGYSNSPKNFNTQDRSFQIF